jgi:nucleoside-diphosphate-sugar epimerase
MSKLIFVTGASGVLASQVIYQLIQDGYRVRATARSKKVQALRELYQAHPSVEIIEVADIAGDDFTDALKGVDAIMHTASPLPGRADMDTTLKSAINGNLNVLRQAEKAGVTKIVVTSSTAALGPIIEEPKVVGGVCKFTDQDWNARTKEDAVAANPMSVYEVSKKYAELALWEWAESHPEFDITTICPPFIYGPFQPLALPIAPGDFHGLASNVLVYSFLNPKGSYPPNPGYIDIRDLAKAHVGALASRPVTGRKRVLFSSPHSFNYATLVDLIKKERPELTERLIAKPPPVQSYDKYTVDLDRAEEVLGFKKDSYTPFEKTFLESVDSVLELEKRWIEQGYKPST